MLSIFRYCHKLSRQNLTYRLIFSSRESSRKLHKIGENRLKFNYNTATPLIFYDISSSQFLSVQNKFYNSVTTKRNFSKKKGSKKDDIEEEESDDDEEDYVEEIANEDLGDTVFKKNVPSLRIDTIIKAGLGVTKKKVEQDFYAMKLRINGEKVLKKSLTVRVGDEIDRIRGYSPDTNKFLIVDRLIIKGIEKLTGTGNHPVKMEAFKQLTVENYEDPWSPHDGELVK